MKRNFARLHMYALPLLLMSLFLLAPKESSAQQQLIDNTYAIPQGNFVTVEQAIERLDIQLQAWKSIMSTMDPHSQAYANLLAKYTYFDRIRYLLGEEKSTDGAATAKAIADALSVTITDEGGGSIKLAKIFKQEAIDLLKA